MSEASIAMHLHSVHSEKGSEYFIKIIELIIACMMTGSMMLLPVSHLLLLVWPEPIIPFFLFRIYQYCIRVRYFFENLFGT